MKDLAAYLKTSEQIAADILAQFANGRSIEDIWSWCAQRRSHYSVIVPYYQIYEDSKGRVSDTNYEKTRIKFTEDLKKFFAE